MKTRAASDSSSEHVKIVFDLPEEQEGYPPVGSEGLWALPLAETGTFVVDNIPFYVRGISSGDVVRAARNEQGELVFRETVEHSGNSTFRLFVFEPDQVQAVRDHLRRLGCESELSNVPNLVAVEIPSTVLISGFLDYIVEMAEAGRLEYQEAALRHPLPE
jgi:hypothetical protein